MITLLAHLSWRQLTTALSVPGALDPLVTSVESGAITLAVLLVLGTPLAWKLARGTLPFPRFWEAGVLCSLLLPPLVIGLLLIFMVGPYTPIGELIGHVHLSATNTFLALVIAQVYESAPYYVLGAQAAFAAVEPGHRGTGRAARRPAGRVARRVTLPLAAPGLAIALAWPGPAPCPFGAAGSSPSPVRDTVADLDDAAGHGAAHRAALRPVLPVVALPLPLAAYIWSARARGRRRS